MTTPDADLEELLSKVGKGVPLVEAERARDRKDIKEEEDLDTQRLRALVRNELLLIDLREKYGNNIVRFLWVYFVFAIVTCTLDAWHIAGFTLPDIVVASIIGGTAVSVLGVVGTVAAGLFRPPAPPK